MKDSAASIPLRDLVFVGGGHAHVHVIKMLGMENIANLRITLISRDILTPYSGMIPGYVCGYYDKEECHLDLYRLSSFANIRYVNAEVYHIDTDNKFIYCRDLGASQVGGGDGVLLSRPPIRYDILSIDIGISPTLSYHKDQVSSSSSSSSSSTAYNITPVKPIDQFANRWEAILSKVYQYCDHFHAHQPTSTTRHNATFHIAVVGGGGGGVELTFAMHYRLHTILTERGIDADKVLQVSLFNKGDHIMGTHGR